ncbi:hypothetical protein FGB62_315g027 [Gracilaria domingensis]|nr:hypothetical protein FGB62_315g027 [Gracilaria domingensis]
MARDGPKSSKHKNRPTSPTRAKHSHHSKSPTKKTTASPQTVPPSPPPSSEKVRDVEVGDVQRGRDYERDSPVIIFLAGLLGFLIGLLLGLIIALVVSVIVCCCFYDARGWWRDRKKRAFLIGFILGILVAIVVVLIVALAIGVRDRDRDLISVPPGTPITIVQD